MPFIVVKIGREERMLNVWDIVACGPYGPTQSRINMRDNRPRGVYIVDMPAPELFEKIERAAKVTRKLE
ncbi:MAG: hypothetical protein QG574_3740 [Cyanobacteriota bacterium erpe_2018_sw_21hr_WHONDRS-SW48-000092_B_bin.40]|jgi:hypothetical protein|nr:hypothetical protein [Cyanobacteriota bacterium erpe_2018_sw_21hr_WHONDRS-SW48-000092_B_bin.40]